MFINVSVAKKLFKRAYSSGLRVGRYRDFLYIGGPSWEMEMKYEEVPYKIKAAHCGTLRTSSGEGRTVHCHKRRPADGSYEL